MVQYYGITMSECNGTIIFVIKLDECQIVKGHQMECVSLTLMNRALQGKHLHARDEHHSIMKKRNNSTMVYNQKIIYGGWRLLSCHMRHMIPLHGTFSKQVFQILFSNKKVGKSYMLVVLEALMSSGTWRET